MDNEKPEYLNGVIKENTEQYKTIQNNIGNKLAEQLNIMKKPPHEYLVHSNDLIEPEKLKGLKEWNDYILLVHNPGNQLDAEKIRHEWLHCASNILSKDVITLRSWDNFGNDPDLIYFRPITPHSNTYIGKNSIIVAIPKNEKIKIFNQEYRVSRNFTWYIWSSVEFEAYDELLSKLGPWEYLRGDKWICKYTKQNIAKNIPPYYIPEICFVDKYISPKYFINQEILNKYAS